MDISYASSPASTPHRGDSLDVTPMEMVGGGLDFVFGRQSEDGITSNVYYNVFNGNSENVSSEVEGKPVNDSENNTVQVTLPDKEVLRSPVSRQKKTEEIPTSPEIPTTSTNGNLGVEAISEEHLAWFL